MIATPSEVGNYKIADNPFDSDASLLTLFRVMRPIAGSAPPPPPPPPAPLGSAGRRPAVAATPRTAVQTAPPPPQNASPGNSPAPPVARTRLTSKAYAGPMIPRQHQPGRPRGSAPLPHPHPTVAACPATGQMPSDPRPATDRHRGSRTGRSTMCAIAWAITCGELLGRWRWWDQPRRLRPPATDQGADHDYQRIPHQG